MTIPRLAPSGRNIKLLSAPEETATDSAGAVTVDWSKGNNQKVLLNANTVLTSANLPALETASLTLIVQQDATGSRTLAFVGGLKASPFVLSTTPNAIDVIDLLWANGALFASIRGKAYA